MAKGYPDFFGFSMFPYYGSLLDSLVMGNLLPSTTADVTSLTGKNHIFGGCLRVFNLSDPTDLTVQILVDGAIVQNLTYGNLFRYNESSKPISLVVYTELSYEKELLSMRFMGGITVEDGFIIRLTNGGSYTMNGSGDLFYTPIAD